MGGSCSLGTCGDPWGGMSCPAAPAMEQHRLGGCPTPRHPMGRAKGQVRIRPGEGKKGQTEP